MLILFNSVILMFQPLIFAGVFPPRRPVAMRVANRLLKLKAVADGAMFKASNSIGLGAPVNGVEPVSVDAMAFFLDSVFQAMESGEGTSRVHHCRGQYDSFSVDSPFLEVKSNNDPAGPVELQYGQLV